MKKPEGAKGTGVRFEEIEQASNRDNLPAAYSQLLLKAAVEKLKCCLKAPNQFAVRTIVRREEWIKEWIKELE